MRETSAACLLSILPECSKSVGLRQSSSSSIFVKHVATEVVALRYFVSPNPKNK